MAELVGDADDSNLDYAAATKLSQLLSLKDTAHYGFLSVSTPQLKRAIRQASHLVGFSEQVVLRS